MRIPVILGVVGILLLLAGEFPVGAQKSTAVAPAPSVPAAPKGPEEKKAEPKKYERDDSMATVPYFLAGTSVILVLLLVCLPARRE